MGSGEASHPDSFNDTLAAETPHGNDLSAHNTLATEALPPSDPGTLAALATVQATGPGDPGWDSVGDAMAASPTSSLDQTTVLPRVELEGIKARVVVHSRRRYETLSKLVPFYKLFHRNRKTDPTGYKSLQKILGTTDMAAFKRRWETYILTLRFPATN